MTRREILKSVIGAPVGAIAAAGLLSAEAQFRHWENALPTWGDLLHETGDRGIREILDEYPEMADAKCLAWSGVPERWRYLYVPTWHVAAGACERYVSRATIMKVGDSLWEHGLRWRKY